MKILLSVIAVCLVMITVKLYMPEVNAEVAGMDKSDLVNNDDFSRAVITVVNRTCYIYTPRQVRSLDSVLGLFYDDEVSKHIKIECAAHRM